MPFGFHADKLNTRPRSSTGWYEVTKWRSSAEGSNNLYADEGFDNDSGRYTVKQPGAYYCFALARLDGINRSGRSILLIGLNGDIDQTNGLFGIDGNVASTNYRGMSVAGTLFLKEKDFVSMYVYTDVDNNWQLHDETSMGCHFMNSKIGFHANLKESRTYASGWRRIYVRVCTQRIITHACLPC